MIVGRLSLSGVRTPHELWVQKELYYTVTQRQLDRSWPAFGPIDGMSGNLGARIMVLLGLAWGLAPSLSISLSTPGLMGQWACAATRLPLRSHMPDVRCEQVPGHMLLAFWEAVAGMVGRLG